MANRAQPHWANRLPARIGFVDVETTGLYASDRVVSLAVIQLETGPLTNGKLELDLIHLIFNPGCKSHPRARDVHGYSDTCLGYQEAFTTYASQIAGFLSRCDLLVAHNASFDFRFIDAELAGCGLRHSRPTFCTMKGYRRRGTGSATLDAACREIGISRQGRHHGALEDAWLAMQVYLWLNGCQTPFALPSTVPLKPVNYVEPQLPSGASPWASVTRSIG